MKEKEITIDIEKFVLFHGKRIDLLKKFLKERTHGRLIYQISFLGFESLARVIYSEEGSSEKRFIDLLSETISRDEATNLYKKWRCPLIHEGFVSPLWTTLETWGDEDMEFISFPETNSIRSFVEYPPGSIMAMYEHLIDYFEKFFRKTNTKKVILSAKRTN